jgi:hypothetical protein
MAKKKALALVDEEGYLSSFKALISMIEEFQKLPLTSTVFEFLENISPYDYPPTRRQDIINLEYPNLLNFSKNYNATLKQLRTQLNEKFKATKPKESKIISVDLEKALERLSNKLTEEKVKTKIVAEFSGENRFIEVEHYGIKMPELKPNIWEDFKPELLNNSYLFEDYFGWLYGMFILIGDVVDEFTTGYKGISKIEQLKTDFSRKPVINLEKVIAGSKWDDFIGWCKHYSKNQELKDGSSEKIITYTSESELFRWNGIGKGKMPSLGVFIKELHDKNYFTYANHKKEFIFIAFLNFFFEGSHTTQQAKDLAKYAANKPNRYKGYFKLM